MSRNYYLSGNPTAAIENAVSNYTYDHYVTDYGDELTMNNDDILKLEAVEDYTLSELKTIIMFLEGGMFCDYNGQAYTREYIKKIAGKGYSTI